MLKTSIFFLLPGGFFCLKRNTGASHLGSVRMAGKMYVVKKKLSIGFFGCGCLKSLNLLVIELEVLFLS